MAYKGAIEEFFKEERIMGGKYSIVAKNVDSICWEYSDYGIKNIISLFIKSIYCFSRFDLVEIRKHG